MPSITPSQSVAIRHNVAALNKIEASDVVRAFKGGDDQLLGALLYDSSPETIIDLQIELDLEWRALRNQIERLLPVGHPTRTALDEAA